MLAHNLSITQQRYDEFNIVQCDSCDYRRLVLLDDNGNVVRFGRVLDWGDVEARHNFGVGVEGLELDMVIEIE